MIFKDQLHRANDLERESFAALTPVSETKAVVQKLSEKQRVKIDR